MIFSEQGLDQGSTLIPINDFFITRIGPRVNPNLLSFYISFGCTYKIHPIASTKMNEILEIWRQVLETQDFRLNRSKT